MPQIRTARQARHLRPVAVERARHSKFAVDDRVFFGGISYCVLTISTILDTKPYKIALLKGRGGGVFFGPLTHAYPTRAEYEASGIHWGHAPRI